MVAIASKDSTASCQPTVILKRTKHHKGSIYCTAWSGDGKLIATGSNDKTIKIMQYCADSKQLEGSEIELTMHDGTVRDLCFLNTAECPDGGGFLLSAGAGSCKIHLTDCSAMAALQTFSGHVGLIYSIYSWTDHLFVTGSQVGGG